MGDEQIPKSRSGLAVLVVTFGVGGKLPITRAGGMAYPEQRRAGMES